MADKNIGKLPPQNLEAESAVLGAVLVNKEAMDKVADILISEDFYSQANQAIFRAVLRLYEKRSPIDLVTLTNELEGVKELDMIGGPAYLADLVNSVPTALHVIHYAEIVKNKSVLRRILTAGQKIAELGYDEDKEIQVIMDEAESALFNVSRQMVSDNFLPISDILAASFDRIDRLHREKGLLRGVTSGFKELDNKLSGFQPSDLIILAARPSMGKCVAGHTQIINPRTGICQTIRELVETKQGEVATLEASGRFQSVKPEQFVADGIKPTFKVVVVSGRTIEATLPHPFLTTTGWKKLVELRVGDEVAVATKLTSRDDIVWDAITSIEPAGMQPVYDLTIGESHNFVANDFIVHNTTLALNFALNAAVKAKVPVGFFSMEQSREQIVDRLLCAQAMVDGWKLRTGNLSESDFPAIGMAMGTLAEAPIFIDDSPILTPIEIRTRARRLQAENKLGLIIVDYLQLLEARRGYGDGNRVQEVSEISRSLKAIARELNVPVIALSQLSRAVESREKKMPQLSDLRESGSIEQDADVVMFMYREEYYDKETERKGITDILIRKHRNGPIGEVELHFKAEHARFYDIDRKKIQTKP
ncbi:MAG: replicative DNA helicase [Patescibacteria group bacterium]